MSTTDRNAEICLSPDEEELANHLRDYHLTTMRNTSIINSFTTSEREAAYAEALKRMKAQPEVYPSMMPASPTKDEAKQLCAKLAPIVFGKKTTLVE
jgi:hypothetical protein